MTADGRQIQNSLEKLLKTCTKHVRAESSDCRFDMVAYIDGGGEFPARESEIKHECFNKKERNHCRLKTHERMDKYNIDWEERTKIKNQTGKGYSYKYDDRYMDYDELWAILKIYCECDGKKCKKWQKDQRTKIMNRKKYGFLTGLHIFEVKSDKDDYSRLNHQIPQMINIANYCWLVLGENQQPPDWLPPYISILKYIEKGKKFKIIRHNRLELNNPQLYRHVIKDHGFKMLAAANTPSTRLFNSLIRKWMINGMFRWDNGGEIVLDMSKEIKKLLKYLRDIDTEDKVRVDDKMVVAFQAELLAFDLDNMEANP